MQIFEHARHPFYTAANDLMEMLERALATTERSE